MSDLRVATMSDDFVINPDLARRSAEATEQFRELEALALEKHHAELERMCVRAIHYGHDFLDVYNDPVKGVEYVAWRRGNEPDYGRFSEPVERFDLRGLTYQDIRRAHEDHA